MNRTTRSSLFALTFVGALAACAPAADEPSASSAASEPAVSMSMSMVPTPSPSASASTAASASAESIASHDMGGMGGDEVMVSMENFVYVEDQIEVSVGTTVTWTNNDSTRHTVTSGADDTSDGTFDSDDIEAGETYSYTFEEEGEFAYFCDIHPTMTGVVVVTP